jgi:hypothetical protein
VKRERERERREREKRERETEREKREREGEQASDRESSLRPHALVDIKKKGLKKSGAYRQHRLRH